jgi:RNA polymerase sigma-70 factor (ECF subfamily)
MPDFQYDPQVGSFKNWLLHTTRWKIADQFRKRPPGSGVPTPHQPTQDQTATVDKIPDPAGYVLEEVWDKEWQNNLLEAALERVKHKVSAEQFQMFDLYALKNWPVQKVARILGANVARVYLAKHRISQLLRKEIQILEKADAYNEGRWRR